MMFSSEPLGALAREHGRQLRADAAAARAYRGHPTRRRVLATILRHVADRIDPAVPVPGLGTNR